MCVCVWYLNYLFSVKNSENNGQYRKIHCMYGFYIPLLHDNKLVSKRSKTRPMYSKILPLLTFGIIVLKVIFLCSDTHSQHIFHFWNASWKSFPQSMSSTICNSCLILLYLRTNYDEYRGEEQWPCCCSPAVFSILCERTHYHDGAPNCFVTQFRSFLPNFLPQMLQNIPGFWQFGPQGQINGTQPRKWRSMLFVALLTLSLIHI